MINVRMAHKRDIPKTLELLKQVHGVHYGIRPDVFKPATTKYTEAMLEDIISNPKTPILAAVDENDNMVGYCFCVFKEVKDDLLLNDVKTLYIDDLCVDESCRGKGAGTALYDSAISLAKESGCYNVTLNVWQGNDHAMEFYYSKGMKPQKVYMEKIIDKG